jgi:hypothetical protein
MMNFEWSHPHPTHITHPPHPLHPPPSTPSSLHPHPLHSPSQENELLQWTLTRPTGLIKAEGGFADDPSHGVLVSAEHIYLPSENGSAFIDFGPYYLSMLTSDGEKWVHKAPFTRYERANKSDIPRASSCTVM